MIFSRILALVFVSALAAKADLANGIKAIVNDTVITYQQVEKNAAQAVELLRRQYGDQPEVFRKKMVETSNNALEDLVQRQLILHEYKSAGYNIPESVFEKEIEQRTRERFGDRATLTKTLHADHLTYETYRQQLKEQIIVEAMRQKTISSEVITSPQKIEAFYNAHREDFKVEDQIKLRMIVLDEKAADSPESRKKLAEEILGKLKEGTAFSELAAIYSTGSQRNRGGDWGWVERSVLRKELADVAFTLKPGQQSGVIETPDACYLMSVEDFRPAQFKPLADVRDDIDKTLLGQERSRLQKEWIERLKKKTFVRYF